MDAQGRLFVADRGNMRIQIFDQEGKYLGEWKQFSRPSGVYIRNDMIYVADSESNGVAPHPGWKRGIRIGSLKDGKVRIPDPLENEGNQRGGGIGSGCEGKRVRRRSRPETTGETRQAVRRRDHRHKS
jgi:hypothetical protein